MLKPLWKPKREQVEKSNLFAFQKIVEEKYKKNFSSYQDLHQWSVENCDSFWREVWDFVGIQASQPYERVLEKKEKLQETQWFQGSKLNFAENLLRYRDEQTALIFQGEGQTPQRMTYQELYKNVAQVAKALRLSGVKEGDRVAGFMPNMIETIVAMLAATSLGAIWSSCSPDFGIKGVLDRFGQIEPKVLFTADGYFYNGKKHSSLERVAEVVAQIPSLEKVVIVSYTEENPSIESIPKAVLYTEFQEPAEEISFTHLPFSHPLYIMYSSGTTGLPKCMVQSAGGILINHLKELVLHNDLKREDTIFYFSTCGWMMWNWLVSSLAVGATVVLYDGSPFSPGPETLWEMAAREKITVFGTSAKYLSALEKENYYPKEHCDLSSLRAILSTGSPLPEEGFDFVYQKIKEDLQLASISGGTDLNGCFVAGNPFSPVYSGEIQGACLGMKVAAFNSEGKAVIGSKGELVCLTPFPSMPIYFWNDPKGEKYHKAYFDVYENIWRHGDYIEIRENGGVVIYGRSDATLNPGGVRIGTAEIYSQVETMPQILDSLVVGQEWKSDVRVILFVKMVPGETLTPELEQKIKTTIRQNASVRHVPAKIIAVADIPYTISMKKVEIAVRKIIQGEPVFNQDALKNPEALALYKNIPELQND